MKFNKHPVASNGESEPSRMLAIILVVVLFVSLLVALILPWAVQP